MFMRATASFLCSSSSRVCQALKQFAKGRISELPARTGHVCRCLIFHDRDSPYAVLLIISNSSNVQKSGTARRPSLPKRSPTKRSARHPVGRSLDVCFAIDRSRSLFAYPAQEFRQSAQNRFHEFLKPFEPIGFHCPRIENCNAAKMWAPGSILPGRQGPDAAPTDSGCRRLEFDAIEHCTQPTRFAAKSHHCLASKRSDKAKKLARSDNRFCLWWMSLAHAADLC
jgi:hypothetical protein